jgi:invasion protein IalB
MLKILTPVSVAALIAAAPLAAQETDSTADSTTGQSVIDQTVDLGQPDDGSRQPGEEYVKEKIGDWELTCLYTGPDQEDPCSMVQVLAGPVGDPLAEVSVLRLPQGSQAVALANVVVPLKTMLPARLKISVDGAPATTYNYYTCDVVGCLARVGLTQAELDAYKKGNKATLTLRPAEAPDQEINVELSLKGFTAAFEKTSELR